MAKNSDGKRSSKKARQPAPVTSQSSEASGAKEIDSNAGPSPEVTSSVKSFPIVGVGASAGGLEAFMQFLEHLPVRTGMAFVLIQHLDPSHESSLPSILSRKTRMPVSEAHGETTVEPDHVYVIPASVNLRIEKGVLHTVSRSLVAGTRNMPIDDFLESLAKDHGNLAFGVILSGTASDGTLGLKAIKAEGGITFAQKPSSAKFDGMPSSAIAAGAVDFVLPPDGIAKQLAALARHPYLDHRPVADGIVNLGGNLKD
jgi:two-component system CheB/CheR fusion protein